LPLLIDHYWSSSLSCPRESLYARQTIVVPDADSADFHRAYCFVRNETLTIAVAEARADRGGRGYPSDSGAGISART
jgi:hypothetical protein